VSSRCVLRGFVTCLVLLTVSCGGEEASPAPSAETSPSLATTDGDELSPSTTPTSTVLRTTTSSTAEQATTSSSVPRAPSPVASSSASSTLASAPITSPAPRTVRFVIPLGTAARIRNGEDVGDVLPAQVRLRVGDTLEIVNNDDAFHIYGPLAARGGETVRYSFGIPGSFQGFCTINSTRAVAIEVAGS
jgi:plastocyanin